jgi:hypothetical protein
MISVMTSTIARDRMPDTRIYIRQQLISTGEFGDTTHFSASGLSGGNVTREFSVTPLH